MDSQDYITWTRTTAVYPDIDNNFEYVALGLTGEAGEIANQVKKIQRDDDGIPSISRLFKLHSELGDLLWYIARMCDILNTNFEELMYQNYNKLENRKRLNCLHGDGEER